ncbi:MAG: hypothetical protein OXH37_00935 [Gammaproteobacteria bacterium]|nr:hypothetical protein [Gammaproteobacteria bacterium]
MGFGVDGLIANDNQTGWPNTISPVSVLEQLSEGFAYAKAQAEARLNLVELKSFVAAGNQINVAAIAVWMLGSDFGPFIYE